MLRHAARIRGPRWTHRITVAGLSHAAHNTDIRLREHLFVCLFNQRCRPPVSYTPSKDSMWKCMLRLSAHANVSGSGDDVPLDRAGHDAEHRVHHGRLAGKHKPERKRNAQQPLPNRQRPIPSISVSWQANLRYLGFLRNLEGGRGSLLRIPHRSDNTRKLLSFKASAISAV